MLRLFEFLGLAAPIAGGVLLFFNRGRSIPAFAWGAAGCVTALVASAIAMLARWQAIQGIATDGVWSEVLEGAEVWVMLRFGLLVIAGALLVIAATVDRNGGPPFSWLAAGLLMMAIGALAHFVTIDLGAEHEGLTVIAGLAIEAAEFGLLGLGILLLCIAAVTRRPGLDGRSDPAELARRIGSTAWRMYSGTRRGDNR